MSSNQDLYNLSEDQKDLLLAALNSSNSPANRQAPSQFTAESLLNHRRISGQNLVSQQPDFNAFGDLSELNDSSFLSNDSNDINNQDGSGELDYPLDFDLDGNYNFDMDEDANGEEETNGNGNNNGSDDQDTRKHSLDEGDSQDPHDAEPKRREGEEKQAKKPGRKPLTSEPTTKRKAQNRAAQRAFRERKEKHLKDLEQKVIDLEKASEATNHENKRLKDQIDQLQMELMEYRRRMNNNGIPNRSTSGSFPNNLFGNSSTKRLSGGNGTGGFSFDFPLFGQVGPLHSGNASNPRQTGTMNIKVGPGGVITFDRTDLNNKKSSTQNGPNTEDKKSSTSPIGNTEPIQVGKVLINEPTFKNEDLNDLSDLFSPSILAAVNKNPAGDYLNRGSPIHTISSVETTPQLSTSGMDFIETSPSASSMSQMSVRGSIGLSSCATSPPDSQSGNSPMSGKIDSTTGLLNAISEENETDKTLLRDRLSQVCGDANNPVPKADPGYNPSLQMFSQLNGGDFEPVIFDDYRDPVSEINSGINSGISFFDDAFANSIDFNLPGTPGPANTKTKPHVPGIDEEDDEDEVVPADDTKVLEYSKIWDKISQHPSYKSGDMDMDNLCSQLTRKAKCSESGAVVGEKDVDALLNRVG